MRSETLRRATAGLTVITSMTLAILACQGNVENMTVNGTLKYVCPSATPRPTHTPLPPDPPRYLPAFVAGLSHAFVDSTRNYVVLYYTAQNVGTVQMNLSGRTATGVYWSGGTSTLAVTGNDVGLNSSYAIYIPAGVVSATLQLYHAYGSQVFSITRISAAYPATAIPPGASNLPAPIYPTPRPTYTPYPSPTPFEISAPTPFFLDDPIYNRQPPVQLRLRMKSPIQEGLFAFIIPLLAAATWQIEITNVGTTEYDFLGAGYTYISEVRLSDGTLRAGVWPPSHEAATFLNITEQAYGPRAVQPGQTITVQVAAWIPANAHVSKVALLLNPYESGDPGWATFTPGSDKEKTVIHWTNATNTICKGEIAYP